MLTWTWRSIHRRCCLAGIWSTLIPCDCVNFDALGSWNTTRFARLRPAAAQQEYSAEEFARAVDTDQCRRALSALVIRSRGHTTKASTRLLKFLIKKFRMGENREDHRHQSTPIHCARNLHQVSTASKNPWRLADPHVLTRDHGTTNVLARSARVPAGSASEHSAHCSNLGGSHAVVRCGSVAPAFPCLG